MLIFYNVKNSIRRINIITGQSFSLPTGAQWEYAARGRKRSKGYKFSGSNNLNEVGWFRYNTYEQQEVKRKRPNELGIYEMSGNVWEWIGDDCEPYTSDPKIDPVEFIDGHSHYLRGGAQDNEGWHTCNGIDWLEGTDSSIVQFDSKSSTSIFPYIPGYNENEFPQYHRLTLQILK